MSQTAPEIQSIPVDRIVVLNPRARNKKIFAVNDHGIGTPYFRVKGTPCLG
ncbi:hypothetical protein [Borborobacter arsenicus]|uniref:hypothetical protein n=1 Tax=Borborobacter arsenicus TaxID=1851146 RepID=UPI00140506CE|nr:hypothetical protein [Pseudaminobacter arsenicus]